MKTKKLVPFLADLGETRKLLAVREIKPIQEENIQALADQSE